MRQLATHPIRIHVLCFLYLSSFLYSVVLFMTKYFCYRFLHSSDVRTKAFQAIDQFLQIAKQYHEKVC